MKYVPLALGVLAMSFIVSVLIGKWMMAGSSRNQMNRYTVIWRDNRFQDKSYTGIVIWLDDWHIAIEGTDGAEIIDVRDVKAIFE